MTTDTITRLIQAAEQAREALNSCTSGIFRDNGFEVDRKEFDEDAVSKAIIELTAAIEAVKQAEPMH